MNLQNVHTFFLHFNLILISVKCIKMRICNVVSIFVYILSSFSINYLFVYKICWKSITLFFLVGTSWSSKIFIFKLIMFIGQNSIVSWDHNFLYIAIIRWFISILQQLPTHHLTLRFRMDIQWCLHTYHQIPQATWIRRQKVFVEVLSV